MSYPSGSVANYFLAKGLEEGIKISPLKLQKLVYYAHGWQLATVNEPLIDEPIYAWPYGPVIPSLYYEFREFGNEPITEVASEIDDANGVLVPYVIPKNSRDLGVLQSVWDGYKGFSAVQLSNMTHREGSPWAKVRSGTKLSDARPPIPNELIRECFLQNNG